MPEDERKRASLFGAGNADTDGGKLNLDRFKPQQAEKIDKKKVEQVSKEAGFTTKHAPTKKKRDGRTLKKSARTSQFNVRLQPETAERFWQGAEKEDMTYADDFLRHLLDLYEGKK